MKPTLLIYSLAIMLVGCKMQAVGQKHPRVDCAKDLVPLIKNNWDYIEKWDYHTMTDTLQKALEDKFFNCILQKDTSWLISILGKHQPQDPINPPIIPNDKTVGSICYKLSPNCTCSHPKCTFYFFYYDSTGRITKHSFDWLYMSCMD